MNVNKRFILYYQLIIISNFAYIYIYDEGSNYTDVMLH